MILIYLLLELLYSICASVSIEVPSITFVDLDGDGDQDIFSSGVLNNANDFHFYENEQESNSLDELPNSGFKIFPNPVTSTLFFETLEVGIPNQVEFVNLLGEVIATYDVQGNSVNISGLSAGQYFIRNKQGEILNEDPIIVIAK